MANKKNEIRLNLPGFHNPYCWTISYLKVGSGLLHVLVVLQNKQIIIPKIELLTTHNKVQLQLVVAEMMGHLSILN
jgi:hypothetical protein